MANEKPQSRPEAPANPAERSVYGGQWGSSGKQGEPDDRGRADRPQPIKPPKETTGSPPEDEVGPG